MSSIGTLRDVVTEEDPRRRGGEWYKKILEKWERPEKKLEPWYRTGSAGDASWKPYAVKVLKGIKSNLNNVRCEIGRHFKNKKTKLMNLQQTVIKRNQKPVQAINNVRGATSLKVT
jgi:hypothetical protein